MTETDFLCLTPIIIIALAPVVIMLLVSILRKYEVVFSFSLVALLIAFASLFYVEPMLPHVIGHLFVFDLYSLFFLGIIFFSAFLVMLLSHDYFKHLSGFREEYFIILFTATLGASLLAVANDFIIFFLGFETLSISLYILIAFQKDKNIPLEAGVKYLVLASVSSAFLLFGMALIYTAFGTMGFPGIAAGIHKMGVETPLVLTGFGMMMVGIGFKLALAPFHMWTPDVYQGAPTAMTMLISSAPKLAAFAFVMRILVQGLQPLVFHWSNMLEILAILSMALGNIVAISQTNLKRMFAYSTIAHMGFLLLGILSGNIEGYGAAMFYAVIYVLMTLGGFGMIMLLSREGFEADQLDDFKGLNQRSPWLAFMMMLLMFSMAGIPPTVGFYAKLSVLGAAVDSGHVPLVVFAVLISLIGAFYYLRIVKLMYFDAPESHVPITMQPDSSILISFNGLAVLLLGILPGNLISVCTASVQQSLLLH